MILKAYKCFVIPSSIDGCLLVFAPTRNKARYYAWKYIVDWRSDVEYVEITAWRRKDFDQYAEGDETYCVETNDDLPEGAEEFYNMMEGY